MGGAPEAGPEVPQTHWPQQGLLCCLEARVETCPLPWLRAGTSSQKAGPSSGHPGQWGGWSRVARPWLSHKGLHTARDKQDPVWTSPGGNQASEPEAETVSFEREKTVSLRERTSQMETMTCGLRDYRQVARHQRRVSSAYAEGKDRTGKSERLQFFRSERRKREAARRGNGEKERHADRC